MRKYVNKSPRMLCQAYPSAYMRSALLIGNPPDLTGGTSFLKNSELKLILFRYIAQKPIKNFFFQILIIILRIINQ